MSKPPVPASDDTVAGPRAGHDRPDASGVESGHGAAPAASIDRHTIATLRELTAVLEQVAGDGALLALLDEAERTRFRRAVAAAHDPDARARRRMSKAIVRRRKAAAAARDEQVLAGTGIRALRRRPVFTTPNPEPPRTRPAPAIVHERHCYICKSPYSRLHHFYDQLCPACAALNYAKRTELADLRGRVALLTGGRVKIGYQAGLKLLRSGARLIVTTRFPRDAATRYASEADAEAWRDRLEIVGLDLRHTPGVEAFCEHLAQTRDRLDFIVNNACQTVRRPPGFYAHMLARETGALAELPEQARALLAGGPAAALVPAAQWTPSAALLSQIALVPEDRDRRDGFFPDGRLDQDRQQIDLRDRNSWRLLLAEVSTVELLEVHLVNAVAPFVINGRLKPLMTRTPGRDKHIVNVSAVEGQFYRPWKTTRHPHTNMAKAALNMMTRTSAADYHADGIHMNSVDTGWVTDEDPEPVAARKTAEQRFHPPLDILDGAARIVDPIISGMNGGPHVWGQFLKDYRSTDW